MAKYRRKGRPLGSTGPRQHKTAVQELKPRHDRIILLHLAGLSNVEIADTLGVDKQTVSNIIGDPKAVVVIEEGRKRVKDSLTTSIESKLMVLANRSVDNLEKTVNANIKVSHPAKRHQDKIGIELLKLVGYPGGNKGQETGLSNEVANRLTTALEKADRVHNIDIPDAIYEEISERKVVNG